MSKAACVAARARSYIGMRYRLGEEGPYVEGPEQTAALDIDCSGLIYAVFRDCGVLFRGRPLWRDTADGYWNLAQRIPGPERAGDMCWFPRIGHKTHVALYIGDDTVIEAGYHGPANTYPGHGYVGTCTVAQMNARGAVWGRIGGLDIYSEEEDMAQEDVEKLKKSAEAQSYVNAITNALLIGDKQTAKKLNDEFYQKFPAGRSGLPKDWQG